MVMGSFGMFDCLCLSNTPVSSTGLLPPVSSFDLRFDFISA